MRRSSLTLNTIALEVVPPNVDRGREQALEEAHKVLALSTKSGIDGRIGHVMMPGLIEEEDDRPIEMKPKLDVLDFWSIIKPEFAEKTDHRPEILLGFGFVPKVEEKVGFISWLIQDPGNAAVAEEQAFVKTLANTEPAQRRKLLLDLYKRVIDGVADLGFPLSL